LALRLRNILPRRRADQRQRTEWPFATAVSPDRPAEMGPCSVAQACRPAPRRPA